MDKVKSLPVLLGETDIIKTAQLMPGIQSGSEGSSGMYVRGGGPDQNLILLDGVPIYNANHLFGFFSVFNADAINSVKIIKGGFPARYGGRLSSVIDIRMNEGNMNEYHGEGSIGIISSKFMLSGPILKGKTSFMISVRRTYIDLLMRPIISSINQSSSNYKAGGGYFFYDINGKINHTINKKNHLYFSAYTGKDKFYIKDEYKFYDYDSLKYRYNTTDGKIQWGNQIFALRWNHQYGPKLFSNLTLHYSNYKFVTGFEDTEFIDGKKDSPIYFNSFEYLSGIQDWGGKLDFYYYPNPKHKIIFGIGDTYHTFSPGIATSVFQTGSAISDTTFGSSKTYSHEFYGYIEDDYSITKKLSVNYGLHFSNLYVNQTYRKSLQPRIAANYILDENSSVKLSYSSMTQFLHLLSNTSVGLPTDFWVPATDKTPPQRGHQIAAGYTRDLGKGYNISFEGYYKIMKDIIAYKEGASFLTVGKDWQKIVEIGRGWSYGAELLFEKKIGKITGWLGYTLSWTWRQFDNINFGEPYPFKYDRRHDISLALTYDINDHIDLGVVWVYGTGNAVTLPIQQYQELVEPYSANNYGYYWGNTAVQYYEKKNDFRMPAYHRLDIGVNIHKKKKWGEATWSYGLYNAYNRQNPFYIEYGYLQNDFSPNPQKVLKQRSLFPIIPSISYSFKF
ncbi:MAG TPA: TonB-dependent receptor [Crocinitomix sp.]|nr:TonB-dependent receptor [Crocinitomix sp.]